MSREAQVSHPCSGCPCEGLLSPGEQALAAMVIGIKGFVEEQCSWWCPMPGFAIQLEQETSQHSSRDTISRHQATSASLLFKKNFPEAALMQLRLC